MPEQIIPITGLDTIGVVKDSPPVSVPPNAFTDVRNVRFKDGAVRKMEGEVNIFPFLFDSETGTKAYDGRTLKYCVWWPTPNLATANSGYYVVILENIAGTGDEVHVLKPGDTRLTTTSLKHTTTVPEVDANWQHTFFQGGFTIILNNGLLAPIYITDPDGNTEVSGLPNFAALPGWESYRVTPYTDTFNTANDTAIFDVPEAYDFNTEEIVFVLTRGTNTFTTTISSTNRTPTITITPSTDVLELNVDQATPTVIISIKQNGTNTATFMDNDRVSITIQSRGVVTTAGVVRSFGDFLVAGNLRESVVNPADNTSYVFRNLSGVVRTSDVAAPGTVPQNWNPFATGVSTADEFVITAEGVVQDMLDLQGNLMIYSNSSISVMRQTGNAQVPLAVSTVTESYGAQTTEAVVEYDGRHFIVGSQDLYIFGGHPGSIQSVADGRVRRFFYDTLNPLHVNRMFCVRYPQRDEIWVCYPTTNSLRGECDQALIWNYRNNTWTIRDLESVVSGVIGPIPGGGLPAARYRLQGAAGANDLVSNGLPEIQTIATVPFRFNVPPTTGVQAVYRITPVPSRFDSDYTGIPAYDLRFTDQFDTGPNFPRDGFPMDFETSIDTRPAQLRWQLFTDGTPGSIAWTLPLPRYLTIDKQWDSDRIYFNGQRAIYENVIYEAFGSPDGTVPSAFYVPDSDGTFLGDPDSDVYHDSEDYSGPPPTQPLRWRVAADSELRTNAVVVRKLREALVNDSDTQAGRNAFNNTFELLNVFDAMGNQIDTEFIIRPRALAGETNPFTGTIFPGDGTNIISFIEDPPGNNGVIGSSAISLVPFQSAPGDTDGSLANIPIIEIESRRRDYFVDSDISMNRYITQPNSVVENTFVAITGNFATEDTDNASKLALINRQVRDSFNNSPLQNHWDASIVGNAVEIRGDANEALAIDLIDNNIIDSEAFIVENTVIGVDTSSMINPVIPPVFKVTPPDSDLETRNGYRTGHHFVYGWDSENPPASGVIDSETILDFVMQQAVAYYTNWDYNTSTNTLTTDSDNNHASTRLRPRLREATGTWNVEFINAGSTGTPVTDYPDSEMNSVVTQEGVFSLRTTPTYIASLISNSSVTEGQEFYVIEAPFDGSNEVVSEDLQNEYRTNLPRLSTLDRGTNGEFVVQPANYNDLANFVLETRFNDSPKNAHWIYQLVTTGVNPETGRAVFVNPASDMPFVNPTEGDDVYNAADSDAANTVQNWRLGIGGPLKMQTFYTGSATNDLSAANVEPATLQFDTASTSTSIVFDVDRPWPTDEVNANQEYPILASAKLFQIQAGDFVRLNKITGADVGWARPLYDTERRVESAVSATTSTYTITRNDQPSDYESYVERVQLPISPEFSTEQLQSLALWLDGDTQAYFRGPLLRNQIQLQMDTTNYPGQLVTLDSDADLTNRFGISRDYKMDTRQHGRFMNFKITDGPTVDTDSYTHQSEWRLSGLQAEVMQGGKR